MKNLVMLVAAAIVGLSLAACGEQKKPEAKVEVNVEQPAEATSAPAEAAAPEAAPAPEATSVEVTPAQ